MQIVASFSTQMKGGCLTFWICFFCSTVLHLAMWNLRDGDVFSACISKDPVMKSPDENSTDWAATAGKRCTDIVGDIVVFNGRASSVVGTTWSSLLRRVGGFSAAGGGTTYGGRSLGCSGGGYWFFSAHILICQQLFWLFYESLYQWGSIKVSGETSWSMYYHYEAKRTNFS